MGWTRTIRYWLAGGKRRWFARRRKRLPAGTPQLVEAIEVGLEVDPEGALAIAREAEPRLVDAPVQGILARVEQLATGPAWRLGWLLRKQRSHAHGLALHHARAGELDALAVLLDDCCKRDLLDRALFDDVRAAARGDAASWQLCQSFCLEHLGDVRDAFRAAAAHEDRRFALFDRMQADALAAREPMPAVMELRELIARETGSGWIDRRGVLERHRAELLAATRATLRADLGTREAILRAAAFEELAGEWGEAALLHERAGELADRLRASQLWEKDERYGEAVRSLGPLSERVEIKQRMAELRETGGDAAGAATLFEHLARWADARRAHEAAGNYLAAAVAYRREHDARTAAHSPEHARYLVQAGRIDELLELALEHAAADTIRGVMREHAARVQSPQLRDAAAAYVEQAIDRGAIDRGAPGWIARARREVEARFGRVWGMDLGTSKSAVAVFDLSRGEAIVCPHKGQPHFASTLALDKAGNELVGLSALEQLRPDLRGCIEGSKRAMGGRKSYKLGDRQWAPEEVAARLLAHGKTLAEAYLRERVLERAVVLARAELGEAVEASWLDAKVEAIAMPKAVVTIPAYFNFDQRRATRDAAEIAGLEVQRLVSEPTAACLSAALTRKLAGKLMVIDLGAGTLDLSYLEASHDKGEGFFEVEQIWGDSRFGSADFDAVIEKHLQGGLPELEGLDRRRLHAAAEQLKIALSTSPKASEELIAFAGKPRHVLELTAAKLEALLAPLLDRLEATCRKAAGRRIDHLILVGGPMFSPLVRKRIEGVFGRKADAVVDPRTAVAMGAACQGAILSDHEKVPFLLLDIAPFALGVLVTEDEAATKQHVAFHIPRGTRIPTDATRPYSTVKDDQPGVDVEIYQGLGESTEPSANTRLAMLQLAIPPAKAREPKIEVKFAIDGNGLLEVTAIDTKTGKARSVRIEDATWLSPNDRADMTKRLTESQRVARERAALSRLHQQISALGDQLAAIERRDAAGAWQRHFAVFQRGAPSPLEPGEEALVAEMYNAGQTTLDRAQLANDRARSLRVKTATDRAAAETHATALRDALATLEHLELQFRRWNACLARASLTRVEPAERFAIHHDAGDWTRSLDAFDQAFPDGAPMPAVHRRLDALARLGRRDAYRDGLAPLALPATDPLNDFGRRVAPAIAWIFNASSATGSGFLVGDRLVVTNRHVVDDPARVEALVGGARRAVAGVRYPLDAEVDLAVLELAEPVAAWPVRVGYSNLVEIGERVVAIGFPLPEGDSFDENLLIDHGIVNRIRRRGDRRELELGLKISPGMSGGPVFNDRGEVVAVSTFIRISHALDRSSHAIGVDALHDLLPRPWGT